MSGMMGGMGLMMVLGVLFVAAILGTAIYVAIRAASPRRQLDGPRELLDRRLADGDITPEEYYERESVLRSSEPVRRRRR